ncbi:hypothetical protein V493_00627 [Pseudogymnoascus sp. VKM F-4281 (FW-2241)]|nr:hypothetical protein V493_00627 [Pseudogymnoascus sp. VKM F-4281 (FW-2241)]
MVTSIETVPNKVLMLYGCKDLRLETHPISGPLPNEVQVEVHSTGICGSDLHYYSDFRNGGFAVLAPLCLGHESAGTVTAIGPSVRTLSVGDRVALEVGMACGQCELCKEGRYNICEKMLFKSSAKIFPHANGTLAELMNHPADLCHRVPNTVSFDQAALIEPLSVSIHGVCRSRAPLGGTALVFGAGAIGLLTAAVLRAQGMSEVLVADIDSARLTIAKDLGLATKTFLIPLEPIKAEINEILKEAQDLSAKIVETAGVGGFDRVYECTGVPSCVQTGIYASKPGGKLVLIGMGRAVQTLPLGAAALREVDIIGVFRYANTYPTAIKLISSGKLPRIHELVTHKRSLEKAEEAFILAKNGRDEDGNVVLKVVIEA